MKNFNKAILTLVTFAFSATSFAYTMKTIDCFDNVEMAKKNKERNATFSLVSAKINKEYQFALFEESSRVRHGITVSSGAHILAQNSADQYTATLSDSIIEVKIETDSDQFYST